VATYWDVLSACGQRIETLHAFADTRVVIRKAPVLVPLQDRFPMLVIAPRADLAEVQIGKTSETLWLGFEIYLGLFVDAQWDVTKLRWRLDRREDLRRAFLPPKSIAFLEGSVWNVQYDPRPNVPDRIPENVDGSWQMFCFHNSQSKGF